MRLRSDNGRDTTPAREGMVVAIIALLAMKTPTALSAQAIRAWRGTITIPTYELGPLILILPFI